MYITRKPANNSSVRVYAMGRCHSKVIYQKCVLFYKFWKGLFVKSKTKNKKIFHSASTTNHANTQICVEDFIF